MRIYKIAQEENALFDHYKMDYEYPYNFDEFIDYAGEYDIPKEKIVSFATAKKLPIEDFGFVMKVNEKWFTVSKGLCNAVDIDDWLASVDEDEALECLGLTEGDLYVSDVGPLKDIRENPGTVYHYTNEDALQEIQQDGYVGQSWGSGLGNRGAHGLFVSMSPEEYADGTYGNVLLSIDLDKFKQENGLPALEIDVEPECKEYLIRSILAYRLELEYRGDHPSDISANTLIVGHNIPMKYVTVGT